MWRNETINYSPSRPLLSSLHLYSCLYSSPSLTSTLVLLLMYPPFSPIHTFSAFLPHNMYSLSPLLSVFHCSMPTVRVTERVNEKNVSQTETVKLPFAFHADIASRIPAPHYSDVAPLLQVAVNPDKVTINAALTDPFDRQLVKYRRGSRCVSFSSHICLVNQ